LFDIHFKYSETIVLGLLNETLKLLRRVRFETNISIQSLNKVADSAITMMFTSMKDHLPDNCINVW